MSLTKQISGKRCTHPFKLGAALLGSAIALSLTINQASSEPSMWAENVCNITIPIKDDQIIYKPVQYEVEVLTKCGLFDCIKKRLETRTDQTIKTTVRQMTKKTCCDGYVETPSGLCKPICIDSCQHGAKCVAPNVCKCLPEPSSWAPGFAGPTCKRYVCSQANKWGAECERDCQESCSSTSYCSANTGKCSCLPGWHGPNCKLACKPGDLADSCQEESNLPPIMEPEVNLLAANEIISRSQKAAALVSDTTSDLDDIRIDPKNTDDSRANSAFLYLMGVLSIFSMVLLVAFITMMRRFNNIRNELYYASVAAAGNQNGSDYSSNYYSAGRAPESSFYSDNGGEKFEKNLSFATTTRNILTDFMGTSESSKSSNTNVAKRALPLVPHVESHLIRSQQASLKNIYSELTAADLKNNAKVNNSSHIPAETISEEDEHIYQVPKMSERLPASKCSALDSSENEWDQSVSIIMECDKSDYEATANDYQTIDQKK